MTRDEAIAQLETNVELLKQQLPDAQLEALAEYTAYLTGPTVYSQLSDAENAQIETGIAQLDRGEGIPLDHVSAAFDARLKAAGA